MLMKKLFVSLACIAALAACDKSIPVWTNPDTPVGPDGQTYAIKVAPVITKVTETKFQDGDAIGLTVTRESGVWKDNAKLTFDGTVFKGDDVKWYAEGLETSTLVAYYPYAAAVPTSFEVSTPTSEPLPYIKNLPTGFGRFLIIAFCAASLGEKSKCL